MATTVKIGPITRVEGHLDVELTVDTVNNRQIVTDAKCSGTMFRGFELLLQKRSPLDATHWTQRICGVCPVSHGMASSMALEKAYSFSPTANGRIMRNLILGANFLQSHILHFYHLAAADYVNVGAVLNMSPWAPQWVAPDMLTGGTAQTILNHYLQALVMRRKAHQMGAIFGGKLPCTPSVVCGGCTELATAQKVADYRALLTELRAFIDNTYLPDVELVKAAFPDYANIGVGCGNLLAYGVFDLDITGTGKLLKRGVFTEGAYEALDTSQITEYVGCSWYTAASGGLNPAQGVTQPQLGKPGAYSFLKAPRYKGKVHEVGPLARMWINGDYRGGPSVIDRLKARALEAKKVADAMVGWLQQLVVNGVSYTYKATPVTGAGEGLTEAPRGALGHWVQITNSLIARYQILTPTSWNASPRDDAGNMGAMEQALVGTPVADITKPVEPLRVIHSFDPCLSCSVHLARPGRVREVTLPLSAV
jgi:hydrogenase large subunit